MTKNYKSASRYALKSINSVVLSNFCINWQKMVKYTIYLNRRSKREKLHAAVSSQIVKQNIANVFDGVKHAVISAHASGAKINH